MEETNTTTVAVNDSSLGRSVAKLVLGTLAGIAASALVEQGIDVIAKRRGSKTETTEDHQK